jgi:hypothetical protein
MTKIVINKCYGGFGLSDEAMELYLTRKGIKYYKWELNGHNVFTTVPMNEYQFISIKFQELSKEDKQKHNDTLLIYRGDDRTDPLLVQIVDELKDKASYMFSKLEIVEVPDDVEWHIAEYDGLEWVAENHRKWY